MSEASKPTNRRSVPRDFYDSLWMRCDLFDPGADALWFAVMAWLALLGGVALLAILATAVV